ncbi:TonB-dependent receptor [Novosphingobium sp. G106]|uniref:TonB-dependent receptor n=1 Tax=Novosphingobium sp. G106 TaxID=2849500 RepID=UPI001C2D6588|nr:TonB-dependent receptor [Novosphingobium sp. G106]MBV1688965.1 TonB-dependent receptor [Novosphingobium sp. G106]
MSKSKIRLGSTVAAVAVMASTAFVGQALAQAVPSQGASAEANQTAPQESSGIADIVVTATRQSQSMQKVPIAITAIQGDDLARSNIVNLSDVSRLSPGVQIYPQFKPGDAVFQVRGQIQSDTAPTIDPSVGVYFDDVYVARSAGSLVNLVDVERVEVLKGPQGTLFGKNTTGGAVRIISNKPTHDFGGYAKGSYEQYDRYTLEGVLNVPLGETLAARFAGQYTRKTGGYATNSVTGKPIDTDKTYSMRGALKWDPTDRVSVLLQGDYTKIDAGGLPNFMRYFVPQAGLFTALEVGLESGLGFNPVGGAAVLARTVSPHGSRVVGSDLRDVDASTYTFNPATGKFAYVGGTTMPTSHVTTWGVMGNIDVDLDFATLKSITAYRRVKANYLYDVDGTQFTILDGRQLSRNEQFSQELILNGKALGDRLDWTVGGIYFRETPFSQDQTIPLAALSYPGRGTDVRADAVNLSYGAFAQGTYKFTDQLSFTAGVRYSVDKRDFTASSFDRFANGTPSTCTYTAANGLTNPNLGFVGPCSIVQKGKSVGEWSYTGAINYEFQPNKSIYVRTSRGFRAGGYNPRINAPEVVGAFKPEIVTDYELGVKADWLDRTLRTNLAVFYSKASNAQQTVNGVSPTNGAVTTITSNVGTRTVKGFELEMIAKPAGWLSFDAGLSYLDAKSKNPTVPDLTYVQNVSPWTWRVGMNLDTPFSESLSGQLRVDLSFTDKQHDGQPVRDGTGNIIYLGYSRDVTLLGARYTLTEKNSGISLSVYGRNLTNQIYESRTFNVASLGIGLGNVAEPRVIGVELKVPFGAMAGH